MRLLFSSFLSLVALDRYGSPLNTNMWLGPGMKAGRTATPLNCTQGGGEAGEAKGNVDGGKEGRIEREEVPWWERGPQMPRLARPSFPDHLVRWLAPPSPPLPFTTASTIFGGVLRLRWRAIAGTGRSYATVPVRPRRGRRKRRVEKARGRRCINKY